MHILLISRCIPFPLHLGDRLIVYHLARELHEQGHEIDLLAFGNPDEDRTPFAPYFRSISILPETNRSFGSYFQRMALPAKRFPKTAGESWSPEMWQAIRERIESTQYDVAHLFGGIHVYEFFHALEPLPAIITPYESYSLYLRRMAARSGDIPVWLRLQIAEQFERWMFIPYRRTVVVSDRDRRELISLNPKLRVDVIPNGIDLDYFAPQPILRDRASLLFTGNFEYAPNVDAAVRLARDILPSIRKSIPEAELWLVGNAPPPEMTALASDRIAVTGRVPDVRPYFAQATAFVSPLRLGAGIKNKVLEALAMGCPVIATPLSIDGITARDGQEALIAEKDRGIVEAALRVLTDAQLRAKLSTNGRALIEAQYSWAQVAARYVSLYREVMA